MNGGGQGEGTGVRRQVHMSLFKNSVTNLLIGLFFVFPPIITGGNN